MRILALLLLGCCVPGELPAVPSALVPVEPREATVWLRHVVPLPKRAEIGSRASISRGSVSLIAPPSDSPIVRQAVEELGQALGLHGRPQVPPRSAFSIVLDLGGPGASSLRGLKNADQAYSISPVGKGAGLRLDALSPPGLYYAAKTLQQLLRARATDTRLEIPLARITDWPDLEDRGIWGADSFDHVAWLADRKLNLVEQISAIGVDERGKGWGKLKPGREPMVDEGPRRAMKGVPVVLHLEQVGQKGVFAAYPNLKARGGQDGALCYSQPQVIGVLADWIHALAAIPGASGVDVWMTENLHGQGGCRCPECAKVDRSLLEARTVLAGWRRAEERLGRRIPLYLLSSEETRPSNARILQELPREVRFWYYDWLTYRTNEGPIVPKDMAEAAARGQWVGAVPSLDAATHFLQPFTGAWFVRYRMREFASKGLSGFLGYVTPRVWFWRFNLEAAAEWSWNSEGRSPEEFALSWAVREGISQPEKWARWAALIGPVEWDLYGSEWPAGAQRRNPAPVARRLRDGKLQGLGESVHGVFPHPWGDIKSPEQLAAALLAADEAVALARRLEVPACLHESRVVQGYARALSALWQLKRLSDDGIAPGEHDAARAAFRAYQEGLLQAADALPAWEDCMAPAGETTRWTEKPVRILHEMRDQMAQTAREMGLEPGAE